MVNARKLSFQTRLVIILVTIASVRSITAQSAHFSAEGVVVATQEEDGASKLWDPNSMGDLAEVFMVRVDNWQQKSKPQLIMIGYTHRGRPMDYKQFDNAVWRFQLREPLLNQLGACSKAWVSLGHTVKTSFGANTQLPKPESLPCFLMEERPLAIRENGKAEKRK
jgi:hypothetical protein